MKIYIAGTSVVTPEKGIVIQNLFKQGHKLHSYYHLDVLEKLWWKINMENKVDLFLDSGAFSAWTQHKKVNIKEYIRFIKEHKDLLGVYANLDVIGIGGKQPNELTAKKTLKNQHRMEEAGLKPLPCFHFGEPFSYLEHYVKNYDYLALGVAGNSGKKLIPWLDTCFSKYICDSAGMPKIKVHGFAVTSLVLMLRYPWWSVDSTSWVVTGRNGSIYIPKKKDGKWIYTENSWKIAVSNRSPNQKEAGMHISTLTPIQNKIFMEYIHEKGYVLGESKFKMVRQNHILKENEKWAQKKPTDKDKKRRLEVIKEPGLCNQYHLRDELNIIYFLDLEKSLPKWPWAFNKGGTHGLF